MITLDSREASIVSDIIYAAYSDLTLPGTWSEVLRLIRQIVSGEIGGTILYSPGTEKPDMYIAADVDPSLYLDYEAYYFSRDIVAHEAMKQGALVARPVDLMPREIWESSEFYTDFIAANGLNDVLTTAVVSETGTDATFHIFRSSGAELFCARDVQILKYLQPHLAQAFAKARTIHALNRANSVLRSGYDQVTRPILMFDADARLTYMNRAAQSLFESPSGAVSEPLVALREAIEALSHEDHSAAPRVELFGSRKLKVGAHEFRFSAYFINPPDAPRYCLVTAAEVMDHLTQLIGKASSEFRLSPREIEICSMIAKGMSNREIAESLCISEFTVKDHLKSVFGKLDVPSRSKAVAKLLAK